jgi:hypothetical protein
LVSTTPRPFYPRERPGTHSTGGWVGPRAGLDVCEKSRPHRDSIPGFSENLSVSCYVGTGSVFFSKKIFRVTLCLSQENHHFIVQIEKKVNKCSHWTKLPRTCTTSYYTAHSNFQICMRLCVLNKIFTFSR